MAFVALHLVSDAFDASCQHNFFWIVKKMASEEELHTVSFCLLVLHAGMRIQFCVNGHGGGGVPIYRYKCHHLNYLCCIPLLSFPPILGENFRRAEGKGVNMKLRTCAYIFSVARTRTRL
jgi:hypothetical protein